MGWVVGRLVVRGLVSVDVVVKVGMKWLLVCAAFSGGLWDRSTGAAKLPLVAELPLAPGSSKRLTRRITLIRLIVAALLLEGVHGYHEGRLVGGMLA